MELIPKHSPSRQAKGGQQSTLWKHGRSILKRSRANPGQIIWKGECPRCQRDRFLIRFLRHRGAAAEFRRVLQVCKCGPKATVDGAADAVELLRQWATEYEKRVDRRTLASFIDRVWLPERRGSPHVAGSTYGTDRRRARRIVRDEEISLRPLDDVTGRECQAFIDRLHHAGLSEHTIRGVVGVLKTILYAAEQHGWISQSPIGQGRFRVRIPTPAGRRGVEAMQRRARRFWRPEQVHAFLSLASIYEDLPDTFVIFACTIVLGLRPGEACALAWSDFSPDFANVRIWRSVAETHLRDRDGDRDSLPAFEDSLTKERSVDVLPVPEILADILRRFFDQKRGSNQDRLVVNRNGAPLTPASLYARWRDRGRRSDGARFEKGFFHRARELVRQSFGSEVDLHYITPYGHRHSCAVYILQFSDAIDAAKALRHSRSTGTSLISKHYGEILEGRVRDRASRMSEHMARGIQDVRRGVCGGGRPSGGEEDV
jgi:integrase